MSDGLLERLDPRHYRDVARLVLPAPVLGWIDSGEAAVSDNAGAFSRFRLLPRVLRDVSAVRTETTVLGQPVRTPIGIAPIGIQKALHPDGEAGMARGAAAAGAIFIAPVNSTIPIGEVTAAAPGGTVWLQLYNWVDRDALAAVIRAAEAAGVKAIVPLVNTPLPASHTPASVGFRLPAGVTLAHGASDHDLTAKNDWSYIEWMAGLTSLPIVPKGILHGDDARRALDAGAKAVLVSNHGNRQVGRAVAAIDALPGVVAAVGGRAEVYLDGGVRNGTDALIALALGARAVFVARAVCWGLACGGAEGVTRVLGAMTAELAEETGMCGVADVAALSPEIVVPAAG